MARIIIMFCGQGAQYYQMGRELYQTDAVFRRVMDQCDEIAGDIGGRRVSEIIYARSPGATGPFDQLAESNVALLAVSYALAMTLLERGVEPERLLGYSLGETVAEVVGGVLTLEDGFALVHGEARLFEQLAPAGAMMAVLASAERIAEWASVMDVAEVSAINAPKHCVLSLLARDVEAVAAMLDAEGVTWAQLPIRYPFHAVPIEPLATPLREHAAKFQFATSRWPIVSATSARVVERFGSEHFWQVRRGRLRFREAIEALAREGEWLLLEAGPSGTLAAFTRQTGLPEVKARASIDQFGQNNRSLQRLLAAAT